MQWYRSGHNEHDWKSCCRQKRHEGSNPSHCARENPRNRNGYGDLSMGENSILPLTLPQSAFYTSVGSTKLPRRRSNFPAGLCRFMGPLSALRQIVVIALHSACRVGHHGFAGVGVHVQCERRCGMSHERLYAFYVRSGGNGYRSAGMPLRYNYDKPEKPRISRVFGYLARFFILFQTEKSSREVVIS